jgi:stage III sporulation protein AA
MSCDENILRDVYEARIRVDKPLMVNSPNGGIFIGADGRVCREAEKAYKPSASDIHACLEMMSGYSLYAFQEGIRNGYITLRGGHRVGVSGQAVFKGEGGALSSFKNINGLNIRIAREVKGCAEDVYEKIRNPLGNVMIISPPGRGKTTLLRDLARLLSDGGLNVSVADERSEIAGVYMGVPQNDVGCRTDVLDGCPKAEGMALLLRSMSPDIIVVDEISGAGEAAAVEEIVNSGVKLLCSAHGTSVDDVKSRPSLRRLSDKSIFNHFVVLEPDGAAGRVKGVYEG